MTKVTTACKCGTLKGVLHKCDPKAGTRVVCYCKDCQAGAHALNASDMLDDRGGSDIFQTIPSRLEITEGEAQLACLRLSPKGLIRWYATCCNTPIFNTLGTPKLRFLGVLTATLQGDPKQAFGPVKAVANVDGVKPGAPPVSEYGKFYAMAKIFLRHFSAELSGKGGSPLFNTDGAPIVAPRVLSLDEREAATPD